jgi:hypothetical protein
MAEAVTTPRAEDLVSVGSRISWGAIFAGALLALGLYFLFTVLGGAVGLTVNERVEPANLRLAAILWTIVTISAALFVGGLVTSLFTVGENPVEAMVYGIIMWALLFAMLLGLGAVGVRAGFSSLVTWAQAGRPGAVADWEAAARTAGVPPEQLDQWRKVARDRAAGGTTVSETALQETATRLGWYTFAGTWISMLAAALGAWIGAGPTFRVVTVRAPV